MEALDLSKLKNVTPISAAEHTARAADRTAEQIRSVAASPGVVPTDVPFLLMCALGWEQFVREMRRVEH